MAGGRAGVVRHAAARSRGPQRGPAGTHSGQQRGLVIDAEKALELAGEIAAFAILDQGGGAHRARPFARFSRIAPGRE
jgi:hypothetical protein